MVAQRIVRRDPLLYESVYNETLDADTRMNLMISEAVANKGTIEPLIRMLWDIDCPNGMSRVLEMIVFKKDGSPNTSSNPTSWTHTSPETNGSRLETLACQSK